MTASTSSAPPVNALVLRALGTNCEHETARALDAAGAVPEILHWNALRADPSRLEDVQLLVLPGGFSFGDDLAAGRVLGRMMRHELDRPIRAFVERGGFVLGICNGFQILVELGLLEGLDTVPTERRIALVDNDSDRYECRWVHLRNESSAAHWLTPGVVWPCPVAHAEGQIALAEGELERLEREGRVLLRYVTAEGGSPSYPQAPNGSIGDIAGLCDRTGRIVGLMPHPERNLTPWHHPMWTRLPEREHGEGLEFFRALVGAAREAHAGEPSR